MELNGFLCYITWGNPNIDLGPRCVGTQHKANPYPSVSHSPSNTDGAGVREWKIFLFARKIKKKLKIKKPHLQGCTKHAPHSRALFSMLSLCLLESPVGLAQSCSTLTPPGPGAQHLRIQFGLFLIESAGEAKKVQYQCRDSLHRPSRASAIPAQPSTAALSPAHSLRQAARQPETPLSPELDYCLTFLPSLQLPLC